MRARLTFVSVLCLTGFACGGSDDAGLFTGSSDAGLGGSAAGGSSGTGASSGAGGAATGGAGTGGATGGSAGTGATSSGGSSGSGGTSAGASGTGGDPGTGGVGAGGLGTGGVGTGGTGGGPTGPSCENHCGEKGPLDPGGSAECYCDALCIGMGDCCADWSKLCNAFVAGQVNCGDAKCKTASEMCCQQYSSQNANYTPKCQSKTSGAGCSGPDIFCDDPGDCPNGNVCCATLSSTGNSILMASCRGSGDCRGDQKRTVLCGGSPNVCPTGTKCETMSFLTKYNLPQYNVCQ